MTRVREALPSPRLQWKDEGRTGPLVLVDDAALAAWKVANGVDPDSWGVPYGSTPDGLEDLGWMTLAKARRVARERGLPLFDDVNMAVAL